MNEGMGSSRPRIGAGVGHLSDAWDGNGWQLLAGAKGSEQENARYYTV